MGRYRTGAITTAECMRLEIDKLVKQGLLKKGHEYASNITWTNGSAIFITTKYNENEMYLQLRYSNKSKPGELYRVCDYKIRLDTVPSNLSKGEIMYFICPETGRRCKILYMAYGKPKFMCREAFNKRLYYPLQLASKLSIYNDRFWQLERKLEPLLAQRDTYRYNGKITHRAQRIDRLIAEQNKMDEMRFSYAACPTWLRKELDEKGYTA